MLSSSETQNFQYASYISFGEHNFFYRFSKWSSDKKAIIAQANNVEIPSKPAVEYGVYDVFLYLGILIPLVASLVTSIINLRYSKEKINELKQRLRDADNKYQDAEKKYQRLLDDNTQVTQSNQEIFRLRYQLSKTEDWPEQLKALITLRQTEEYQKIPIPEILNDLEVCLINSTNIGVRWHVLQILEKLKGNAGLDLIVSKGLRDTSLSIQAHALYLLGKHDHHDSSIVEQISSKCNDNNLCIQANANWALRRLIRQQGKIKLPEKYFLLAYVLINGTASAKKILKDLSGIRFLNGEGLAINGVVECGVVYGRYDAIAKIYAQDSNYLNEIIMREIQTLDWVKSTRTFIVVNEPFHLYWHKDNIQSDLRRKRITYILFRTPALNTGGLIACLYDIKGVVEAAGVYGESDAIAKIELDNQMQDQVIDSQLKKIPFVESTEAFIVAEDEGQPPKELLYNDSSHNFKLPEELKPSHFSQA